MDPPLRVPHASSVPGASPHLAPWDATVSSKVTGQRQSTVKSLRLPSPASWHLGKMGTTLATFLVPGCASDASTHRSALPLPGHPLPARGPSVGRALLTPPDRALPKPLGKDSWLRAELAPWFSSPGLRASRDVGGKLAASISSAGILHLPAHSCSPAPREAESKTWGFPGCMQVGF